MLRLTRGAPGERNAMLSKNSAHSKNNTQTISRWQLRHLFTYLLLLLLPPMIRSFPEEPPQATATDNSSTATKRIQSESAALGPNGQYLLHRVESHGRRLIGEAMADGLV